MFYGLDGTFNQSTAILTTNFIYLNFFLIDLKIERNIQVLVHFFGADFPRLICNVQLFPHFTNPNYASFTSSSRACHGFLLVTLSSTVQDGKVFQRSLFLHQTICWIQIHHHLHIERMSDEIRNLAIAALLGSILELLLQLSLIFFLIYRWHLMMPFMLERLPPASHLSWWHNLR